VETAHSIRDNFHGFTNVTDTELLLESVMVPIDKYEISKMYVTPLGVFNYLREVKAVTGLSVSSVLRRINDKRHHYRHWYLIKEDTPLNDEELCAQCNKIDDTLFDLNCWMTYVDHDHKTDYVGNAMVNYLYKGLPYSVSHENLMCGDLPHTHITT